MCKRIIIYFFFFFITLDSNTQIRTDVPKSELDSLIRIIPDFRDEELVDHLNLIATSISQRYPDSCFYYARKAIALSQSLNYIFGEAEGEFNLGNGYFFKFDIKNATEYYLVALNFFEKSNPSLQLGNLLIQLGIINSYIQNHLKSISFFRRAAWIFQKLNLPRKYLKATYLQAHECIDAKLYDSAFYYFTNVIQQARIFELYPLLSMSYNGYGITYLWRDDCRNETDRYEGEAAIPYFDSALAVAGRVNFKTFKPDYLVNMAECYHHYMNPQKRDIAEEIYYKAIISAYEVKDYSALASIQALLGELYADNKNESMAKIYLDSSLISAQKFYSSIDTIVYERVQRKYSELSYMYWTKSFTYRGYYKLYRNSGDLDNAIFYYQLMVKIIDSLKEQQSRSQIDYLIAADESKRINEQIELLELEKETEKSKVQRTNYILIIVAISFILAALIFILYNQRNRIRLIHEKTMLQQKLLRSQMNPHFIFNSLASIQNAIINEEPKKASKYLAKFSRLVRNILDSSVEEFITLEQEMSTIENYLGLQKIRFPDKFDYTIEVDERLDPASVRIPPMLAQPFIENAIEHGIKHKDTKGKIDVRFKLLNGRLELEVEDDGVGRQRAQEILREQDQGHKSMATAITMERIRVLNKKLKHKISMEIIDLKDEQDEPLGTRVVFGLPI
jgi:hypothetical protein